MGTSVFFERAVVIGTGLIGGSMALALKAAGIARTVIGVARTEATRRAAIEGGVVDEATPDARAAVSGADLAYIAVPLGSTRATLRAIAPALSSDCLVTDAGSAKTGVVQDAESSLPHPRMFVGGHPMAGAETAGVRHARADLFRARSYFLTPTKQTSEHALERAKALVAAVGAELLIVSPDGHDDIVAAISHVPHMAAVALVSMVAPRGVDAGPSADSAMRLKAAAGGFRDMTRIVQSPGAMWRDILEANREQVLRWLEAYTAELDHMADIIRKGDWTALEELLSAAAEARQRLD